MKSFPAFLLLTLASAAWSVALGASIGSKGHSGPQAPSPPNIDITLTANLLASTLGQLGQANANQQVVESVSGDAHVPASLTSSSGINTELSQTGAINEIIIADPVEETSGTSNQVFVENVVAAAADDLEAYLIGANGIHVEHSGESSGYGGGIIEADGHTSNNLNNPKGTKV